MTFLLPWGLLALLGVPALVWLWRWSASKSRTVVSSLIPFEHLLRRTPSRRTRPVVNALFWIQVAALALLALALAGPTVTRLASKTTLVILDTSASMGAARGGPSAFERAKSALTHRLSGAGWRERFFIVTTAPVAPLTPEPSGRVFPLQQAVGGLQPAALEGNITMALRVGTALLGRSPDAVLVFTDEPLPSPLPPGVSAQSFGAPLPNAAIVGVETQASLCTPGDPNVTVTVQNFSDREQSLTVTLRRGGRVLGSRTERLEPQARLPVAMALPDASTEPLEVTLVAEQDALAADNRAWVRVQSSAALPLLIATRRPDMVQALGRWLDACPRLQWEAPSIESLAARMAEAQRREPSTILITDQPQLAAQWQGPAVVFGTAAPSRRPPGLRPDRAGGPRRITWLVDRAHPIGEYLQPIETVTAAPADFQGFGGDPVIWSMIDGQRAPLVQAAERGGRRIVTLQFDPLSTWADVPPVIVLLNSLRWLSGSLGFVTTGEPLTVGPLDAGMVRVQRPDGSNATVSHGGGLLSYDATDQAGVYRIGSIERLVNFINPVESNVFARASTWAPETPRPAPGAPQHSAPVSARESMAGWCLGALLALWLAEWLLYSRKGRKVSRR